MKKIVVYLKVITLCAVISSCSFFTGKKPTGKFPGEYSTLTGLAYNNEEDENTFKVGSFKGQPVGPNLRFIEGGRTVLGTFEQDVAFIGNNPERTVTVASFYIDETEVANIHWLEYLHYVRLDSSRVFYESALPDTTVWARTLALNDPYVKYYFRYPGFRYYPVVGVTWKQAQDFCSWRSVVVNQKLAEDAGYYEQFTEGESTGSSAEDIPVETGFVLPNYRLPTEAEWEYAAQALIGTQYLDEINTHRRLYPWDGHSLRNSYGKYMGEFLANFKRGRGDYAGIAGHLNDGAMVTTQIYAYPPNDFGLYNMAGNVNEWVQDVYRPLSYIDFEDLNPVRRDGFLDEEDGYDMKNFNSLVSNRSRVYKGGSWADVPYWLAVGTRRYLDEDSATSTIGFRCAMIRAGGSSK